jgi:hypothetical protein
MEKTPWEANKHSASQKNSLPFIEHESSLLYSQELAISLYPKLDKSSPYPPTLFFEDQL